MRRHERVESPHLQGTVAEAEDIAHQLCVHGADEGLIFCQHATVAARCEIESERLLIDDGVETRIVEVFVQDVHLAQSFVAEIGSHGRDRTEHPAACMRPIHPRLCRRTRRHLAHRVEHHRRAAAVAGSDRLTADQALVLQYAQMVTCRVQRDSTLLGERAGVQAGSLLDGSKQAKATRLSQTSKIMGTTGHGARISTLAGGGTRFGRK